MADVRPAEQVQVLWCTTHHPDRVNGWSFPTTVEKLLLEICNGFTVLHLFGGLAEFGIRLDIDEKVRPEVVGDAWMVPFKRDAFDVVVLDPPYRDLRIDATLGLLRNAAFCARRYVIWFHTHWISSASSCRFKQGWLVRVGSFCATRCLQVFEVLEHKSVPRPHYSRGPGVKYNRWMGGQYKLL